MNSILKEAERDLRKAAGFDKKGERSFYKADFPDLVDIVLNDNEPKFLLSNGEIKNEYLVDDKVYLPPPLEELIYRLPNVHEVLAEASKHVTCDVCDPKTHTCKEDLQIYEGLIEYHKLAGGLPNESDYDLITLWDFHTHLIDRFNFSPMIYFYAVKERGKTRLGKSMIYVAKRGIYTESIREADLIRWSQDDKASIFFDVKDFSKKVTRKELEDLIFARFEKGFKSQRTLWPEKGAFKDRKTFTLFGPTIIASNRQIDEILESRVFPIYMRPSRKDFEDDITPELGLPFLTKLIAFKLAHFNCSLISVTKPVKARLGDSLKGFKQIVMTFFPSKINEFDGIVKRLNEDYKERASETLEAQFVSIVKNLSYKVEHGFLATEDVTEKFNKNKSENQQFSNYSVGRYLSAIGFAKKREGGTGKKGIFYDEKLIEDLALTYEVESV